MKQTNKLPGADEREKNEVIVRVLQLVDALVKYGYYNDEKSTNTNTLTLLPLILSVLKTNNDHLVRSNDELNEEEDATEMNVVDKKAFRYDGKYRYKEEYHYYNEIKHW